MKFMTLLLLWTLSLGAHAGPIQEAEVRLPKGNDLVLGYFTPEHASTHDMLNAASQLFGTQVEIRSDEGAGSHFVHRFMQVGETIVVQDDKSSASRVLAALAEMDEKVGEGGPSLGSLEYTPRHVDPNSIMIGLDSIHGIQVRVIQERKMLVVQGTPAAVQEAKRVAESIDRPAHQVTLTCQLIRGFSGDGSPDLPSALTENLKRLVPMKGFELLSASAIRASVTDRVIELHSESDSSVTYDLRLQPTAFDASSGTLTLSTCSFSLSARNPESGMMTQQHFTTSLSVKGGEYTVLGAIGDGPIFAVLRMVPDAQPN